MKKFVLATLTSLMLIGCSVHLSEVQKNSDYFNTIVRGQQTHNAVVIYNQTKKILENQKIIIEQNEKIIKLLQEK